MRRPAGVGGWVGLRTWSLGSSGCVQQDSLVLILFYEDLQLHTPGPRDLLASAGKGNPAGLWDLVGAYSRTA